MLIKREGSSNETRFKRVGGNRRCVSGSRAWHDIGSDFHVAKEFLMDTFDVLSLICSCLIAALAVFVIFVSIMRSF